MYGSTRFVLTKWHGSDQSLLWLMISSNDPNQIAYTCVWCWPSDHLGIIQLGELDEGFRGEFPSDDATCNLISLSSLIDTQNTWYSHHCQLSRDLAYLHTERTSTLPRWSRLGWVWCSRPEWLKERRTSQGVRDRRHIDVGKADGGKRTGRHHTGVNRMPQAAAYVFNKQTIMPPNKLWTACLEKLPLPSVHLICFAKPAVLHVLWRRFDTHLRNTSTHI